MPIIKDDSRDPIKKQIGEKLLKLGKEDPEQLKKVLSALSPKELDEITYDPEYWARDKQWIDVSKAPATTILMCGRGLT